jgi:hypothetical protein
MPHKPAKAIESATLEAINPCANQSTYRVTSGHGFFIKLIFSRLQSQQLRDLAVFFDIILDSIAKTVQDVKVHFFPQVGEVDISRMGRADSGVGQGWQSICGGIKDVCVSTAK